MAGLYLAHTTHRAQYLQELPIALGAGVTGYDSVEWGFFATKALQADADDHQGGGTTSKMGGESCDTAEES